MLYTSPECAEGQGNLPSCTLFGCFAIAWRRHHTARLQQLASDGQNGEQVDMNAYVFVCISITVNKLPLGIRQHINMYMKNRLVIVMVMLLSVIRISGENSDSVCYDITDFVDGYEAVQYIAYPSRIDLYIYEYGGSSYVFPLRGSDRKDFVDKIQDNNASLEDLIERFIQHPSPFSTFTAHIGEKVWYHGVTELGGKNGSADFPGA